MKAQAPPINPHRLARGIRWAQAMLAWLAFVLCAEMMRVDRRHIRQRYGRIQRLHRIERFLASLLINHALAITGLLVKRRPRRPVRNIARTGFQRRIVPRPSFRAILGSRLRRLLRHRDLIERIRRLWAAFGDIDGLVRAYLVKRSMRGLTRINPILISAPPGVIARALAAPPVALADSS